MDANVRVKLSNLQIVIIYKNLVLDTEWFQRTLLCGKHHQLLLAPDTAKLGRKSDILNPNAIKEKRQRMVSQRPKILAHCCCQTLAPLLATFCWAACTMPPGIGKKGRKKINAPAAAVSQGWTLILNFDVWIAGDPAALTRPTIGKTYTHTPLKEELSDKYPWRKVCLEQAFSSWHQAHSLATMIGQQALQRKASRQNSGTARMQLWNSQPWNKHIL